MCTCTLLWKKYKKCYFKVSEKIKKNTCMYILCWHLLVDFGIKNNHVWPTHKCVIRHLPPWHRLERTLSKSSGWHKICWPNWTITHMSSTNTKLIPLKNTKEYKGNMFKRSADEQSYQIAWLDNLTCLHIQHRQKLISFQTLHAQNYHPVNNDWTHFVACTGTKFLPAVCPHNDKLRWLKYYN
jgi:hypothetical protein